VFIVEGRPGFELLLQIASRDCKYINEQKSALEIFGTARKLERFDWGAHGVCSMMDEAETNS
jgi:ribonuclease I